MTTDGKKMDKLKLLIIDDDVALCKSLNDTLELEDYLVEASHTAKDGIKKIEQGFYNIVLQDMKLPDSDGIEALQKIKEISPDVEVIIFTAFVATENVIEAMDRGAFSYLPKPFEMTDLITTLKKACERQSLLFENRNLFSQMSEGKKDWENAFDSISDLITIIDADANIVRCNKALADKMCVKTGDVIGEKCYAIFQDSDSCLPDCPALKLSNSVQKEINYKDRILLMSCSPKFDKSGIITGVVNIARDITAQKYAEEKIHKLSCAVEQSPVTTVIADTDGNIQYVNPKFSQLTGYTEQEAIGQNPRILKSGKTSPGEYKKMWAQIRSGKEWHGEFCNKKKNGEIYWENAIISSIKNSAGDITNFIAIKEDITQAKKIEEELLSSEERFRAISATANDAIVMINNDGTISYWNKAAEKMFYYSSKEVVGKKLHELVVPTSLHDKFKRGFTRFKDTGVGEFVGKTVELIAVKKDGTEFPIEHSIAAVKIKDKWNAVGVIRDISERKKIVKRLEGSEKKIRTWLECSPVCTKTVDLDFNLQYMSAAGIKCLNIGDITPFYGKPFPFDLYPEMSRNIMSKSLNKVKETGETIRLEVSVVSVDGNILWFDTTLVPVNDDEGKIDYIIVVSVDITERKYAEEQTEKGIEKLRMTLNGTIAALSLTVEQRDPYTAGHQRRVSQLACAIAEEMGLSKDQIEGINVAGIVHDMGKIHIPTEILSRPGKLTKDEYNIVRSHAQVGYDILKGIEFPWPVADIVHQHHEHMDGSGYPLGLSDGDILMEARIICVADVVEAMASHRPYRPSLGMNVALEEILRRKGVHYDARVVKACLEIIKEKGFEFEQ